MNTGKLYEIFAVPVYETELGFDVNKMTDLCRKFVKDDKGRNISNRGGYQSNDIDLSNKSFADFFANIEFHATGFAASVLTAKTQFMHNAWININNYGDYNVVHNHPYSHISGVYYLKTPKDCGRLVLQNSAKDVLIYPNPTSNEIHIKGINEPTNFTITSNDGKQVMSGIVSENKSSISVQEIPLGNYIITLSNKKYTIEKQ